MRKEILASTGRISALGSLRLIVPTILLLLLAAGCGSPQTETETAGLPEPPGKTLYNPPYPNDPVEPFKIIGNVYYVGMANYSAYLITTPEGHFLLDTMVEETLPDLRSSIEKLGFNLSDIKIVLQAHAHRDHVGGLADIKELTGAEVLVMEPDAEVLADGGVSDFRGDGSVIWKPVQADRTLQDGEEVRLGGVTMVAHLTAGHSKGCTAWSTVAEENGQDYNVVFVCSNRVNPNVPLLNNPKYPTVAEDYARGFQTLRRLPCDVFLASHAFMFGMQEKLARWQQETGENPFIDPEGYRTYVDDWEAEFEYQLALEKAGARTIPGN